ncbi:MAG: hypothetical protein NTW96_11040 [Planctomycetia bacterium]|nr:hypothetical protein [Planctomycetia bacterium]
MSRKRTLAGAPLAAAGVAMLLLVVSSTQGGIIAQWRFEPDDPETPENEFLLDSSGNGNLLANYGAASMSDPGAGFPGMGAAAFDGTAHMRTASPLDLSPYRHVRVSWWQRIDTAASAIVWEHSPTFIGNPGSIVADVNDAGNAGRGLAGVWTASSHYNLDVSTSGPGAAPRFF